MSDITNMNDYKADKDRKTIKKGYEAMKNIINGNASEEDDKNLEKYEAMKDRIWDDEAMKKIISGK